MELTGGANSILSLRESHRNPEIHTKLTDGAKKPLSSRGNPRLPKINTTLSGRAKITSLVERVLKATASVSRKLAICRDECREPRSGLCQSGGTSNNNDVNKQRIDCEIVKYKVCTKSCYS
ncbi:hypothetical protein TNCV_331131 [Trichonephila clavipes]|nr:hypothetical protein TNCV_331131 [Trichonephila clavipes]